MIEEEVEIPEPKTHALVTVGRQGLGKNVKPLELTHQGKQEAMVRGVHNNPNWQLTTAEAFALIKENTPVEPDI